MYKTNRESEAAKNYSRSMANRSHSSQAQPGQSQATRFGRSQIFDSHSDARIERGAEIVKCEEATSLGEESDCRFTGANSQSRPAGILFSIRLAHKHFVIR
jgi:hypothetical protein